VSCASTRSAASLPFGLDDDLDSERSGSRPAELAQERGIPAAAAHEQSTRNGFRRTRRLDVRESDGRMSLLFIVVCPVGCRGAMRLSAAMRKFPEVTTLSPSSRRPALRRRQSVQPTVMSCDGGDLHPGRRRRCAAVRCRSRPIPALASGRPIDGEVDVGNIPGRSSRSGCPVRPHQTGTCFLVEVGVDV